MGKPVNKETKRATIILNLIIGRFETKDLHLNGPRNLSCLWNAMIVPFLNVTIYGSIWYQGEENAERPMYAYNCTFPAMIDDWRAKWYLSTQHNTDPMFPFGFVQVGVYRRTLPENRWVSLGTILRSR
jgi:hypothetical protein